jgi:hypothetical protein
MRILKKTAILTLSAMVSLSSAFAVDCTVGFRMGAGSVEPETIAEVELTRKKPVIEISHLGIVELELEGKTVFIRAISGGEVIESSQLKVSRKTVESTEIETSNGEYQQYYSLTCTK